MKRISVRILLRVGLDLLLVGAVLLSFAFFHHVRPAILAANLPTEPVRPPMTTPAPTPAEPTAPGQTLPPQTTPADPRTPWQIRFQDKFSQETVMTANSYRSPNVSITIETVVEGQGEEQVTYYVADIYIASMENFVTYTAHNRMVPFDSQRVLEMDRDSGAILAISGDFFSYQSQGFAVRNGAVFDDTKTRYDICVLYPDGVMATYAREAYEVDQILAQNPLQVWHFGPSLLDGEGRAKAESEFVSSLAVEYPNPRSAIGYYEPGHYCFVVVDGRRSHSRGVSMLELAQILEKLQCKVAYNLDGGGSAVMTFDDRKYSVQSGGERKLGDILLIRETEAGQ